LSEAVLRQKLKTLSEKIVKAKRTGCMAEVVECPAQDPEFKPQYCPSTHQKKKKNTYIYHFCSELEVVKGCEALV
jgi:hypothetical protein